MVSTNQEDIGGQRSWAGIVRSLEIKGSADSSLARRFRCLDLEDESSRGRSHILLNGYEQAGVLAVMHHRVVIFW